MLYKFLGPERFTVLQDFKIRFTQPCQLNDPFETSPLIDAEAYVPWEKEAEEIAKDLVPETEEDFELLAETWDYLRAEAKEMMSPHAMGQGIAGRINRSIGVLSLSRANDNLLMWAHYGSSHKGFVLGLDDSHDWFRETNWLGKVTKPHNVIYTSRRAPIKVGTEDFYDRLLCYKSVEWAYEEEVRIFRTFGSSMGACELNYPEQVHLFDVPKDCIKEVFIGAHASPELREKLLAGIGKNGLHVDIYEAYINKDRYEVNFRPVERRPDYTQRRS
jgi:hypothetical protein